MVAFQSKSSWLLAFCILIVVQPAHAQIADRCHQWQRPLTRIAQYHMGLKAPIGLFAAQVQAESACNPKARSRVAHGLAQFTRPTVKDMRRWYKAHIKRFDPYNPRDALHALVLYDNRLYGYVGRHSPFSKRDRWSMTLGSYNWGPGNVNKVVGRCRRKAGCDHRRWSNLQSLAPRETRGYVKKICRLESYYQSAGWGGLTICQ